MPPGDRPLAVSVIGDPMFLMNFRLYMLGRKLATANKNLETAMEEKFLADTSRSHSIKPTEAQHDRCRRADQEYQQARKEWLEVQQAIEKLRRGV